MEFKIINSFALNDVVHHVEWESSTRLITEQARYIGKSSDGTIHLFIRRWNEPKPEPQKPGMIGIGNFLPIVPLQYEVKISPNGHSSVALALWRLGDGDENFKCAFYIVGDLGQLVEVERPAEAVETPKTIVGFHHDAGLKEKN